MTVLVSIVYGWTRAGLKLAEADPTHLAALGALEVDCLECEGSGLFWSDPDFDRDVDVCPPCVECKGTGRIFVGG